MCRVDTKLLFSFAMTYKHFTLMAASDRPDRGDPDAYRTSSEGPS
jgi:hypothetical protein